MRLTIRKALNFVNHGDHKSFKKYLKRISKTSKIRRSMESLNDDLFQFSAKIIKSFVLSS